MKKAFVLLVAFCMIFVVTVPNAGAYSVRVGDMDSDYLITAADARTVLRAVVGLDAVAAEEFFRNADANANGTLEAEDARLVLRAAVGLKSIPFQFEDNSNYWSGYGNRDLMKAYASVVNTIVRHAGQGTISSAANMESLTGTSVVRLIDFDSDGQPELYCAFSTDPSCMFSNRQAVYGYAGDGKVKTLYDDEYTNNGSDYSPLVWFIEKDNAVALVTGMCFDRGYLRLENGEFKGHRFAMDWDDFDSMYVDGNKVPVKSANALEKQYTDGAVNCRVWLFEYGDEQMLQYNKVLAETERVIALLNE